MTTFASLPGKLPEIQRALDSLVKIHPAEDLALVDEWWLVNEVPDDAVSAEGLPEALEALVARHPALRLRVVQKTAAQRGQARSLNLLVDMFAARRAELWVHWEEAWEVSEPFLRSALATMRAHPELQQLLLAENPIWWRREAQARRFTVEGLEVAVATVPVPMDPQHYHRVLVSRKEGILMEHWPLYSLRPHVCRVDFAAALPRFSEDPQDWPIRFEYLYGARWVLAGGITAATVPPQVTRQLNHNSTYRIPRPKPNEKA
jgi:hypothetical protein